MKTKQDVWRNNARHSSTPYGVWSAQLNDAATTVDELLDVIDALLDALEVIRKYATSHSNTSSYAVILHEIQQICAREMSASRVQNELEMHTGGNDGSREL